MITSKNARSRLLIVLLFIIVVFAINSERDFRKTQQKISNNIENSLQMIA